LQRLRTILGGIAVLLTGVICFAGCGKPNSPSKTTSMSGALSVVNGQVPPRETPPDWVAAKAAGLLHGPVAPEQLIAGVSSDLIGNTANSWLGTPYLLGGNSRSGIDCSHLVYQVYRGAGVSSYPFMATPRMRKYGHFVCANWNDDGGDIVLFASLAHTGIYIGNGWMIDANSYYKEVMWDNLNNEYWQRLHPYLVRFVPWESKSRGCYDPDRASVTPGRRPPRSEPDSPPIHPAAQPRTHPHRSASAIRRA
jgi:hypothetical protein